MIALSCLLSSACLWAAPWAQDPVPESEGDPLQEGEPEVEAELQEEPEEDLFDDGLDDLLFGEGDFEADGVDGGSSSSEGIALTQFKGFLGTRFRSFPFDRSAKRNNEQFFFEGEIELDFDLGDGTSAFFHPRFLVDAFDGDMQRFEPFEAYVSHSEQDFDLRAGQFVESWGIVDTYNPLELLNRQDFNEDFLDPDRLGELGARARYFFEGGSVIGEPTIGIYAMPVFREAQFPTDDSRFAFGQGPFLFLDEQAVRPSGFDQAFLATRYSSTLTTSVINADLQALVARGPERFPTFLARPVGGGRLGLIPVYFGAWSFGGGFRAVPNAPALGDFLAELTFKAELLFKDPYPIANVGLAAPDDYFSYVLGVDRVITRPFAEQDQITLTVEYAGESGANDFTSVLRPFRNDAILRLFWEANDFSRTSIEARVIYDLDTGETIVQGIFETQLRFLHEDLRFNLDVQSFTLDRTENSLFNFFPNNSSITAGFFFEF